LYAVTEGQVRKSITVWICKEEITSQRLTDHGCKKMPSKIDLAHQIYLNALNTTSLTTNLCSNLI